MLVVKVPSQAARNVVTFEAVAGFANLRSQFVAPAVGVVEVQHTTTKHKETLKALLLGRLVEFSHEGGQVVNGYGRTTEAVPTLGRVVVKFGAHIN